MLVDGGVEAQAEQVMKNMGAVLEEAGLGFGNVVKTTVRRITFREEREGRGGRGACRATGTRRHV